MAKTGKILIVDDDPLVLEALNETFLDDYDVVAAASGQEALQALDKHGDLDAVVLDIKMARMDGLETACRIREINPDLPVIFHTGYPGDYSERDIDTEHQPFDYVGKNERPARLHRSVRNAVFMHRLRTSSSDLVELARRHYGMVGRSRLMRDVYQMIEKIGPTNNKVMILGPTGTGKELVARALHHRSRRADETLAIFNCNHKAPDLVESELFGHLRGSFTGAVADRVGMFEYAHGGTVFLDEIGNLDITTQGKLLRVLETGEMQRIGSPETIRVDVRVICATNCDLEQMVSQGKFREDLYYRLKGIRIVVPTLADRREDIPDLIDFFTENYCRKTDDGIKVFEPAARDLLIEYDWPGNVRQLQDTVQSLIDLSLSYLITRIEVQQYLSYAGASTDSPRALKERVREFKRLVVIQCLARHGGNVAAAARELGLDSANLRKMIKDLDIETG
ncbi:MAG: sigma-54-dependent Fis family transcriptional regulator [candidate division Zixibacteria bacterium]|nr:sigma-54-dependent Fis family transcriptional regulator [candidate division Zixibacteria bacterium]